MNFNFFIKKLIKIDLNAVFVSSHAPDMWMDEKTLFLFASKFSEASVQNEQARWKIFHSS